jgi:hypothetical protein
MLAAPIGILGTFGLWIHRRQRSAGAQDEPKSDGAPDNVAANDNHDSDDPDPA